MSCAIVTQRDGVLILFLIPALFLFLALPTLPILHFLLDQKVKQKIKSHRRRSGEISLGHHAESVASLVTTSAFRMLLSNRNFTLSSLPRCDSTLTSIELVGKFLIY